MTEKRTPADTLRLALTTTETTECLLWPHAVCPIKGYAKVRRDGRTVNVHRYVIEATKGPAPDGTEAAHSCGVRHCVNPHHLRWATPAENQRDRIKHGTTMNSLTPDQIRELRRARENGATYVELGERFGVSKTTAWHIVKGVTCSWVT